MLAKLILLFIFIPLVEVWVLLKVGSRIGFWYTLACIVITGILGAGLARIQGLQTLWKLRQELAAGQMPGETLIEGVLILIAGAVLLTPGFITDLAGFALLYPPIRGFYKNLIINKIRDGLTASRAGGFRPFNQGDGDPGERGSGDREVRSTWRVDPDGE